MTKEEILDGILKTYPETYEGLDFEGIQKAANPKLPKGITEEDKHLWQSELHEDGLIRNEEIHYAHADGRSIHGGYPVITPKGIAFLDSGGYKKNKK